MFRKIEPTEISDNTFKLIGKDWMLITGGNEDCFNTMTASWGGVGVLWNKNVTFSFVRPQRYTYEFMEKGNLYTLSFFGEEYRSALNLCGKKSGRDTDKIAETGLTPINIDGAVSFAQARLVLVCEKMYISDINPENFLCPEIADAYKNNDYHRMYIGKITGAYINE